MKSYYALPLTALLLTATVSPVATFAATPTKAETPKPLSEKALAKKKAAITKLATSLIGTPYKEGGTTTKGFDASGFTQYVYQKSDLKLERTIAKQATMPLKTVTLKKAMPGDLLFVQAKKAKAPNFVGIYTGKNKFVAVTTKKVESQDLTWSYYAKQDIIIKSYQ
ncbi:C40 family peptidase [Exiguobacterium sp. Helios]|uniref:C40 family peptidase n=1 Tax=Exiguobacterium sp. Helios TaxID=2735868 RepID=UPI00165DFAE0|nr:C40 family peptidase [Exiguobacterium sp. Helios]QNR20802.1 C40 family peptidase [Exiguobacterium sp. Helios]